MIKDILVVLSNGSGRVGPYALSFARRFGAHVTATCVAYESALAPLVVHKRSDLLVAERDAGCERAGRELEDFVRQARDAGVVVQTLASDDLSSPDPGTMHRFARCFDMTVIGQQEPRGTGFADEMIASLLSGSGRPVLVVPYIQRGPASFDAIVVAWDGSAAAARALGNAMPLLAEARKIEIVTVDGKRSSQDALHAGAVVRHLARRGILAELMEIPGERVDVGNVLLSHLADAGADLMVVGGYGHSPLRERLLGGVTRTLLGSMTAPILMSH